MHRLDPEGTIPLIDITGSPHEAGQELGEAWQHALRATAPLASGHRPWWQLVPKLAERYAPHLPDLYRGMAKGAGLRENQVGDASESPAVGCTSFAIHPDATLSGEPISGQTKDTPLDRCSRYQLLRLRLSGAPSALTLTYPGWLFGHGFVQGGCAIFRNALYAGDPEDGDLPYLVWGLLALHCPDVEAVQRLTRDHPPRQGFHCTVQDEQGDIVGIECAKGGCDFLEADAGLYVHANAIRRHAAMQAHETAPPPFTIANSRFREQRLMTLLAAEQGRLTPQLAYRALGDHQQFPESICRHQSAEASTTAAIIAEPTRGRLTVCRGPSCQNWPVTCDLVPVTL